MTDVSDLEHADYFSDQSLNQDPYRYFESLRKKGPVTRLANGVVAVVGHEEACAVYRDPDVFSNINCATGPFPPLPFTPEGDDITWQIDQHRHEFPLYEDMATFDPPEHTAHRALLVRLFTPKRVRENEEFMWRLADRALDEFVPAGRVEVISQYSQRFTLLVICDLLGVPEEDHKLFREMLVANLDSDGVTIGGVTDDRSGPVGLTPFEFLDDWFTNYISDRRRNPRSDVLTHLATTTFPDGSLPSVDEVVRLATFLFVAGHETTAKLIAQSVRVMAEDPELQERLRDNRDLIPNFIEENMRLEGPTKAHFRLARRPTSLGGVDIPAGTTIMIAIGGANRDPRLFDCPLEFRPDRANAQSHVGFARGAHSCPGASLARTETRVSLERILDRMLDIRLSEDHHGPPGARRFEFVPTYVLRGLRELHVEFTPNPEPSMAPV